MNLRYFKNSANNSVVLVEEGNQKLHVTVADGDLTVSKAPLDTDTMAEVMDPAGDVGFLINPLLEFLDNSTTVTDKDRKRQFCHDLLFEIGATTSSNPEWNELAELMTN
jgi:hypothetical protein